MTKPTTLIEAQDIQCGVHAKFNRHWYEVVENEGTYDGVTIIYYAPKDGATFCVEHRFDELIEIKVLEPTT